MLGPCYRRIPAGAVLVMTAMSVLSGYGMISANGTKNEVVGGTRIFEGAHQFLQRGPAWALAPCCIRRIQRGEGLAVARVTKGLWVVAGRPVKGLVVHTTQPV